MKRCILFIAFASILTVSVSAQKLKEMVNPERYGSANNEMSATPNDGRLVVFFIMKFVL